MQTPHALARELLKREKLKQDFKGKVLSTTELLIKTREMYEEESKKVFGDSNVTVGDVASSIKWEILNDCFSFILNSWPRNTFYGELIAKCLIESITSIRWDNLVYEILKEENLLIEEDSKSKGDAHDAAKNEERNN